MALNLQVHPTGTHVRRMLILWFDMSMPCRLSYSGLRRSSCTGSSCGQSGALRPLHRVHKYKQQLVIGCTLWLSRAGTGELVSQIREGFRSNPAPYNDLYAVKYKLSDGRTQLRTLSGVHTQRCMHASLSAVDSGAMQKCWTCKYAAAHERPCLKI